MQRDCSTCAKLDRVHRKCLVLTVMLGLKGPCWAWTDDPEWRRRVNEATKAYALRRLGKELDDAAGSG